MHAFPQQTLLGPDCWQAARAPLEILSRTGIGVGQFDALELLAGHGAGFGEAGRVHLAGRSRGMDVELEAGRAGCTTRPESFAVAPARTSLAATIYADGFL